MANKVRVGSVYTFKAVMFDVLKPPVNLKEGEKCRVINMPGCPKANTMGMCYVERLDDGQFGGMVCTNSLTK